MPSANYRMTPSSGVEPYGPEGWMASAPDGSGDTEVRPSFDVMAAADGNHSETTRANLHPQPGAPESVP